MAMGQENRRELTFKNRAVARLELGRRISPLPVEGGDAEGIYRRQLTVLKPT